MGTEIERKFLLQSDAWRDEVRDSVRLVQGYLARGDRSAIRIRIKGDEAELNIKKT
ncbi:MAG: CYTH domain-containing protein, partial [Sedimenticolaceae bacterium]